MADTITITPGTGTDVVLTVIPGSVKGGGGRSGKKYASRRLLKQIAVEAAVLDRLQQMRRLDFFRVGEVGDGA